MNLDLSGKLAIVGGASKGIGRAVAEELASLGAAVTLFARNEAALQDVKSKLKGQGHLVLAADYFSPQELKTKTEKHVAQHGPFHILVNNTGGPPAGPAHKA